MELFMQSTKMGLRFPFNGNLSTEDLWALSLENLDALYRKLRRQIKDSGEDSLLTTISQSDTETQIKVEVVKAVVAAKLADRDAAKALTARNAQKQKLLEVLARKQDAALEQMTAKQIEAALAEL